jgi:hypothetical protein
LWRSVGAEDKLARKVAGDGEAFDLYASQHWALHTMFETSYEAESPISDPAPAMVAADLFIEPDAP